ncbi:11019_t:CDS:2 [Funneliformis geosporum]|uniref:14551_t:CDS:1 n=1 Tax=Funneliformis geosporum TaxID=1117311 RepID=A0A9W4SQM1_9GLOM|nr:14551_t:CDS:2 [Funneliformis geosporum]CAI2195260.1 11019_t:CDS:2 [Funneliformis geosporum]
MASLFLLTLATVEKAKSGQGFNNCLTYAKNDSASYDLLLKFPFNSFSSSDSSVIYLCCNVAKCLACSANDTYSFHCRNFLERIQCGVRESFLTPCGGIIGDKQITANISIGLNEDIIGKFNFCKFYNSSDIINYISNVAPFGIEEGYASYPCPSQVTCSVDKNPLLATVSSSSLISSPTSSQLTPNPVNDLNLTKIFVPVGGVTFGVIVIGGTIYVTISKRILGKILDVDISDLDLEKINTKINELDQHRNVGKNFLKKVVWNYSNAQKIYNELVERKNQLTTAYDNLTTAYDNANIDLAATDLTIQLVTKALEHLQPFYDAAQNQDNSPNKIA